MIETPQAGSQRRSIEVHEKPRWAAGQFQIRDDLGEMDGMYPFDGFQLHHETVVDEQIQLQLRVDSSPLVVDRDSPRGLDTKPGAFDLDNQTLSVHRFQQSWSEGAVHLDRAANDPLCQRVDSVGRVRHGFRDQHELRRVGSLAFS